MYYKTSNIVPQTEVVVVLKDGFVSQGEFKFNVSETLYLIVLTSFKFIKNNFFLLNSLYIAFAADAYSVLSVTREKLSIGCRQKIVWHCNCP